MICKSRLDGAEPPGNEVSGLDGNAGSIQLKMQSAFYRLGKDGGGLDVSDETCIARLNLALHHLLCCCGNRHKP